MSRSKVLLAASILLLSVLGFAAFSTPRTTANATSQASQSDNNQSMQALLSEVRQLRLALQRSNLNAYHAQVTLERLRLQQQRVDRLNDRLADVRKEIAGHQQTNRLISEQIKNFDTQLGTETDPNKRRELENVKNHHKSLLEQATQGESQARENETLLNSQLQVEQSKLNELNDKLDALQKEVEAVDKQPDGKRQ